MYSIKIKVDKSGCVYIIDELEDSKFYKLEGNIGNCNSGYIYRLEDINLYEASDEKYILEKSIEGEKYLEPTSTIIDGKYLFNNIKLNLEYKEVTNILLKGRVLLNRVCVRNSLVEILKLTGDDKEIKLGYTITDKEGMYYINTTLDKNSSYKLIATYVSY